MSSIRVKVEIEVSGPLAEGGPCTIGWTQTVNTGDNPRFYAKALLAALEAIKTVAEGDLRLVSRKHSTVPDQSWVQMERS